MKPLLLGRNAATGRRLFITPKQRSTHMFVPGRTGTGKTTFLEFLIRQDIRAGNGLCLLDPDGELFNNVLAYCAKRGNLEDRVLIVDPNENDYRVGLNYFDLPGYSAQKKVGMFIEACYKVLGQSQQETKVLFERWGMAAAKPLAGYPGGPLTLAELHPLLVDTAFRSAVLATVPAGTHLAGEWRHFDDELRPQEKNTALFSVLNRCAKFASDERMEEILGQPNCVDWLDAMNAGKIVLVNLYGGGNVTADLARMLGVLTIHQIVAAAMLRPENPPPKPFYVYVDEFSAVVTEDFRTALKRLRKRGVSFTLAQQDLKDLLLEDDGKLFDSVINNTTNKVAFGMENADDAAVLARHLFAGQTTGTNVKWQGVPVTQAVPIAKSAEVAVETYGHSRSRSGDSSQTDSSAGSYDPDGDELLTTRGVVRGHREAWSDVESGSTTYQTAHWTEYEYNLVEQAPQLMSIEEELHHYSRRILRQDIGEAQLKYDPKKPTLALRTFAPGSREFPRVWTSPELVAEFRKKVYGRMGLPRTAEVRRLIADRRQRVLAAHQVMPLEGAVPEEAFERLAKRPKKQPAKPKAAHAPRVITTKKQTKPPRAH